VAELLLGFELELLLNTTLDEEISLSEELDVGEISLSLFVQENSKEMQSVATRGRVYLFIGVNVENYYITPTNNDRIKRHHSHNHLTRP